MITAENCILTIECIDCPRGENEHECAWSDRYDEIARLERHGWDLSLSPQPILQSPDQAYLAGFCDKHAATGDPGRIPD